eukprot:m.87809 g.87809  ORF g.87809 m.87809 type:complete len:135 (+) comp26122_c0_seq1:369-773(+)
MSTQKSAITGLTNEQALQEFLSASAIDLSGLGEEPGLKPKQQQQQQPPPTQHGFQHYHQFSASKYSDVNKTDAWKKIADDNDDDDDAATSLQAPRTLHQSTATQSPALNRKSHMKKSQPKAQTTSTLHTHTLAL